MYGGPVLNGFFGRPFFGSGCACCGNPDQLPGVIILGVLPINVYPWFVEVGPAMHPSRLDCCEISVGVVVIWDFDNPCERSLRGYAGAAVPEKIRPWVNPSMGGVDS